MQSAVVTLLLVSVLVSTAALMRTARVSAVSKMVFVATWIVCCAGVSRSAILSSEPGSGPSNSAISSSERR